eukprot:Gregarina_sp_Poly_1__5989@NODE_3154_length_1333_cov_99_270932_g1923_i1_p1_GENE_NODE_3154_length_1333_cov_99_270932_g1923_i1NODE_3154_length_1333_cov_99_270932_g1923_i1_p1_ORF_typecomplete_len173_score31_21CBM_20/PF00686_19/4_6e22_NODE_3154_length_1333_cov_99_270932_g1923_i17701288
MKQLSPGLRDLSAVSDNPARLLAWQEEERNRERLRIRAKYAQRNHERKVEVYFKALELVRQRELAAVDGSDSKRSISFIVNFATYFGQELYITGNTSELGEWNPDLAVKMVWSEGNNWMCDITFSGKIDEIQYKYLVKDDRDNINWEWGLNHEVRFFCIISNADAAAESEQG